MSDVQAKRKLGKYVGAASPGKWGQTNVVTIGHQLWRPEISQVWGSWGRNPSTFITVLSRSIYRRNTTIVTTTLVLS